MGQLRVYSCIKIISILWPCLLSKIFQSGRQKAAFAVSHPTLTGTAVSVTKTPTSSITGAPSGHLPPVHQTTVCADTAIAGELLFDRLWYRAIAKIEWLLWGNISEASTARPSPSVELPQELVEMIIFHLIYNKYSRLAYSMTCYSWYIAAVPRLHHPSRPPKTTITAPIVTGYTRGPDRSEHYIGLAYLRSSNDLRSACQGWETVSSSLPDGLAGVPCVTLPHLRTSRNLGSTISKYPASCQRFNSALDTSHRPSDSSSPNSPTDLPDRSCTPLDSSRTSKTSSSSTPSPRMKSRAEQTQRSFPSPYPHCGGS